MGSWEREAWVSSLRIVDGRGDKDGFEKFGAIDTCRVQFESGRRATGCFCPPSMKPAWVLSLRYLFVACALEASRYLTYVLPLVDENIRIGTTRVQALDREAKRSLNGRCHRRCWQSFHEAHPDKDNSRRNPTFCTRKLVLRASSFVGSELHLKDRSSPSAFDFLDGS